MSVRARLAALHDRSGLDLDDLASACSRAPGGLVTGSSLHWQSAFLFVYRTGRDPGEEFWTVLVRAPRDGECFAPECPQEIEDRRGRLPHCPLDVREED